MDSIPLETRNDYQKGFLSLLNSFTPMNPPFDPILNDTTDIQLPSESELNRRSSPISDKQKTNTRSLSLLQLLPGYSPTKQLPTKQLLIGVLPGEGVGPEVIRCSLEVLTAVAEVTGLTINTREGGLIGRQSECTQGCTLSNDVIQFCKEIFADGGAILNGPGGGRYVYELRKQFDLFFKASPLIPANGVVEVSRLKPEWLANLNILVTRENYGGIYQGEWTTRIDPEQGRMSDHRFAYTETQVRRFLEVSAKLAHSRHGNLTVVWKESGIPSISRLWKDCAIDIAKAYDIELSMIDIDLMAYRLIQEPSCFDVIATPNLFGDVIADLGAVLLGSRGISFSGNFTPNGNAVYQTNHGAAYPLAGTDKANPAGQIYSLAMMLRESFGLKREASFIEEAVRSVWREGYRTEDVCCPGRTMVGTREFGSRVAECAARIARAHA